MASDTLDTLEAITIRPAVAEDAVTIRHLLADLVQTLQYSPDCGSSVQDILHHGFGERSHFEALIAEAEGAAVGLVLFFYNYSTWRGRLGVYVQDLHVVERYRGRGLGRKLLAAAARHGRAAGCSHLRLSVDPRNQEAVAFYHRVGLTPRRDEIIYQVAEDGFDDLAEEKP